MKNNAITIGASYSTLSAASLMQQVVPLYQLNNPHACEFWARGVNDTYVVHTDEGKYILRVYRKGWRTKSDIQFELDALLYLHEQNAPVSCPIPLLTGDYIKTLCAAEGERYAIVMSYANGHNPDYDDSNTAILYGRNLALIHEHARGFTNNQRRYTFDLSVLSKDYLPVIQSYMLHRQEDWQFINAFANRLLKLVSEVPVEKLDVGFCHGDCHGQNAHIENGEITFFDFDFSGFGLRAFDLAVFNWTARMRENEQMWLPFLAGYQEVRTLTEEDMNLVDKLVALRDIWLMGFHMSNAHDFAKEWLNDAYLDKHMKFLRKAAVFNNMESI